MTIAPSLAFLSALFAAVLALAVGLQERRSVAAWLFMAGMGVLSAESTFAGLAAGATLPAQSVLWHRWAVFMTACLPGPWLAFSLSYARGNASEFLTRWRYGLAAAFVLPIALAIGFQTTWEAYRPTELHSVLDLGNLGSLLFLSFLITAILVLMNLERTFRASVGTMRWRIKFMIL